MEFSKAILLFGLFLFHSQTFAQNPNSDLQPRRFLIYDISTPRPKLSTDLNTAKNQTKEFCNRFIAEYSAAFAAKAGEGMESPFVEFCPTVEQLLGKATSLPEVESILIRIDERANQTVYFQIAKKFEKAGGFFETRKKLDKLEQTVAEMKGATGTQPATAEVNKNTDRQYSLFSFIGLGAKGAQLLEGALILLNLIGLGYLIFTGRRS